MRATPVLSLLLLAPLATSAEPAQERRAKTIDELAAMFDSTRCKQCHAEIYAQWEKSHHARPLMGVAGGLMLTPVVKSSAFQVKEPKEANLKTFPCFKCHLPQAVTHGEDSIAVELTQALFTAADKDKPDKDKAAARAKVAKLQITCTVCHHEKAIVHRRLLGAPEKNVIYGTKDGPHGDPPDRVFAAIKKSAVLHEAVFCGQCHGTGPNFEFDYPIQCATLYGSYQHNYLSKGGFQSCQECHMQKAATGKADHTFLPNWDDKEGTAAMLAKNVHLDVQTMGYQWLRKAGALTPMIVVNTKIRHDAGHRIPDG
jgi:hypothetical protein